MAFTLAQEPKVLGSNLVVSQCQWLAGNCVHPKFYPMPLYLGGGGGLGFLRDQKKKNPYETPTKPISMVHDLTSKEPSPVQSFTHKMEERKPNWKGKYWRKGVPNKVCKFTMNG